MAENLPACRAAGATLARLERQASLRRATLTASCAPLSQITDVYMMPAAIVESMSVLTALRRTFLSAAVHGDHYHLYYKCAQHQPA